MSEELKKEEVTKEAEVKKEITTEEFSEKQLEQIRMVVMEEIETADLVKNKTVNLVLGMAVGLTALKVGAKIIKALIKE